MQNAFPKGLFGSQQGKALGQVKADLPAEQTVGNVACALVGLLDAFVQDFPHQVQVLILRMLHKFILLASS